jgi:hypothetical protein
VTVDPTTIEWAGLTMGLPTWRIQRLDGWEDLPGIDSGDDPRPTEHGSWPGTSYAQARVVTAEVLVRARSSAILDRVRDLRRALALAEDGALGALTISVLGERLTADARVSQRIMPLDKAVRLGHVRAVVQWTCPDPLRYEPDLVHVVVPPGQVRSAPQHGTTRTRPVITIYGPCTDPAVTVTDPASSGPPLTLAFTAALADGESLVVDCQTGTATYGTGVDASDALATGSVPIELFAIPPGVPLVELSAATSSGAARAHVVYRHAYL